MSLAQHGAVPYTAQKTVGTSAAVIVAVPADQRTRSGAVGFWVKAPATNSAAIYIGGSNVTTSNGFIMSAGDTQYFPGGDPSVMYAIVVSGTQTLCVLYA